MSGTGLETVYKHRPKRVDKPTRQYKRLSFDILIEKAELAMGVTVLGLDQILSRTKDVPAEALGSRAVTHAAADILFLVATKRLYLEGRVHPFLGPWVGP